MRSPRPSGAAIASCSPAICFEITSKPATQPTGAWNVSLPRTLTSVFHTTEETNDPADCFSSFSSRRLDIPCLRASKLQRQRKLRWQRELQRQRKLQRQREFEQEFERCWQQPGFARHDRTRAGTEAAERNRQVIKEAAGVSGLFHLSPSGCRLSPSIWRARRHP